MADQYFLTRIIIVCVGIGIVALLGVALLGAELFMRIFQKIRERKIKTRHTKK